MLPTGIGTQCALQFTCQRMRPEKAISGETAHYYGMVFARGRKTTSGNIAVTYSLDLKYTAALGNLVAVEDSQKCVRGLSLKV